ncbi:MAG TPA: N-acetylglucosamine-6-phosphate deacetylase, partial [Negativicutes bacterium]|nr:N-acetylglucosamine-6-phosphate deacetylase [Negativicutes bacterium]
VLIENGIIKHIGKLSSEQLENSEIYDASGYYMIPGFIDCHTHGFNGYRAEDSSDALRKMAVQYALRGITGFYATVGPETNQEYFRIFDEYRKAFGSQYQGARFLGLHVEGPFLSLEKKGAMDERKLRRITQGDVQELICKGYDVIGMITIAPELEGACNAIEELTKAGITVSIGHSAATYGKAAEAIAAGATQATHMYNAMRPYDHRETGIIGAAILSRRVYCELIMDCVHVSMEAMRILVSAKRTDRIMAVSDGDVMCGSNCPDKDMGDYIIKDGAMYLKDGLLCGSTRDLSDHFRTIINKLGMGMPEAVKMTSTNCAEHMGIKKGKLERGFDADFNLVDGSLKVHKTFVAGQLINA